MKAQYRIYFTDKDLTFVKGKTANDIYESEKVKNPNLKMDDVITVIKSEKAFLEILLQQAMKDNKKLSDIALIIDIAQTIENSVYSFLIDEDDFQKYLIAPMEKIEYPPFAIKLSALIKQLKKPEEIKTEEPKE